MQTIDFVNSFDYNFFNTFMGGIFVDFKQLTYIITIAEEHNLTKAAERLFVSQSTLSLYLNKLERELGVALFTRNKNRLTITPEGEEYVKTARKILELRNDLYKKLKISQNQFSISIGISCQTLFEQFGQIYADFHEIFPNISVRVTEGWSKAIIEKLYDEKLDLAFAGFPEIINNPLFNTEVIKTDELLVLLSPQHAYAHLASRDYDNPPSVDMRLFSRESFILSGHGVCEYLLAQNMFRDYDIAPHTICEMNNRHNICQMVLNSNSIALLPAYGIPRNTDILVCRPDKHYYRYMQLFTPKKKNVYSAEMGALKNMLIETYLHSYD